MAPDNDDGHDGHDGHDDHGDHADDDHELTTGERRALDTWQVVEPSAGFADRVIAAQQPQQPAAVATARVRRWPIVAASLAAVGAIALVVAVTRGGGEAAEGSLSVNERTTSELGHRATIVAEPAASVRWHVSASGAAEIEQTAGDVFYRVERGGPFVVHTPAGDIRVTGTCLRIEVIAMKPTSKMLISGAVGAALATAVVVTVYEGHVIAEGRTSKTEVSAGSTATMSSDGGGAGLAAAQKAEQPIAIATATREQLVALAEARGDQISRLKAKLDEIEKEAKGMHGERAPHGDEPEEGRPWHDPSHERLVDWAGQCKIAFDEPDLERFTPFKSAGDARGRGLQPAELDAYNATLGEQQKQWLAFVRALYIDATGDAAGADTLSVEAMQNEIRTKSPPNESGLLMQKLSRERAGMQPVATDTSKMSPLERLYRAELALGDQVEQALARRVGAPRASQIRGNNWLARSSLSGCPGE